jgi:YggT family protein
VTISFLVATLGQMLTLAIIVRTVLSWFPPSRTLAPVSAMLNDATDPILRPVQRRLPLFGGFDLSPFVSIILINIVVSLTLGLLAGH